MSFPMTFQWLHLKGCSIQEQLLLEQQLLSSDERNWCIVSEGSSPTIVMGISGKKEELVDEEKAQALGIPLIKRFSGGGTVVVDENTLFVTLICQKELHPFPGYPEPIMRWTEGIYREVFDHPHFCLKQNDYVIENRKCGGNAQYIKKQRWLHHTSFLWDYTPSLMELLLYPKKTPAYREGRSHDDFLCRLLDFFPSKQLFIERLMQAMQKNYELILHPEGSPSLLEPGRRPCGP